MGGRISCTKMIRRNHQGWRQPRNASRSWRLEDFSSRNSEKAWGKVVFFFVIFWIFSFGGSYFQSKKLPQGKARDAKVISACCFFFFFFVVVVVALVACRLLFVMHVVRPPKLLWTKNCWNNWLDCTYLNLSSIAASTKHRSLGCFCMPQPKKLIFAVFSNNSPNQTFPRKCKTCVFFQWFWKWFNKKSPSKTSKLHLIWSILNSDFNNFFWEKYFLFRGEILSI